MGETTALQDKLLETNVWVGVFELSTNLCRAKHLQCLDNAALVLEHLVWTKQNSFPFCTSSPTDQHHSRINCFSFHFKTWIIPICFSASYLNSELPHGANWNARNGSIVVGGDNGALLCAPNTGHAL